MARHTGGDDLDDGLELDPELLASDAESGFDGDEHGSEAGFLSEEEVEAPTGGTKRKLSEGDEGAEEGGDAAAAKRKKRREKDKARRAAKVCNCPAQS